MIVFTLYCTFDNYKGHTGNGRQNGCSSGSVGCAGFVDGAGGGPAFTHRSEDTLSTGSSRRGAAADSPGQQIAALARGRHQPLAEGPSRRRGMKRSRLLMTA